MAEIHWIKIYSPNEFSLDYPHVAYCEDDEGARLCCYHCGYDDIKFSIQSKQLLCEDCTHEHLAEKTSHLFHIDDF